MQSYFFQRQKNLKWMKSSFRFKDIGSNRQDLRYDFTFKKSQLFYLYRKLSNLDLNLDQISLCKKCQIAI